MTAAALALPAVRRAVWRESRAWVLGGIGLVEVAAVIWGVLALPAGRLDVVDTYVLTNVGFGVSFGVCGLAIAVRRPAMPIGWLLLVGGLAHLTTAALSPWSAYGHDAHWPHALLRLMSTGYSVAWPFGILLAFPLALLLFPTGTLLSRRWRWVIVVQAASCLGIAAGALDPHYGGPAPEPSLLAVSWYDRLDPLWTALNVVALPAIAGVVANLVVRYVRGDEIVRRQLRWLVFAAAAAATINVQRWATGNGPILLLLAFEAIPLAIGVGILRHQLLDIRLVVSRGLLYLVLTGAVIGAYVGSVAVIDALAHHRVGLGPPAAVAIVLALAFNPLRLRLQRVVDRLLYGDRDDPVRMLSRLGERLAAGDDDQVLVVDAIRDALRLPYAAIRIGERLVESGVPPAATHTIGLRYGGRAAAELIVGVRYGEDRLADGDERALELVSAPLAVALHATALAEELQDSRGRIVLAREEERRRLRRDLHDGLGPALTGVAFTLDATRNVLADDPERADTLLAEVRAQTTAAIEDIRRLVYALRPPALDELGLVGALRAQAGRLCRRDDGVPLAVTLDGPAQLPELPAAVEVAAYRIAVEALANVAHHSVATGARLCLRVAAGALDVEVLDDGGPGGPWRSGVGLVSMTERAAEVGGSCAAGPGPTGGRVHAVLPLTPSS